MMQSSKKSVGSRGFTLIELLVVIAIIGLLAAIVLASVGTARSKGVDATVQGQLNSARSQAELYSSGNSNSYSGVCADTTFAKILAGAASPTGATVQGTFGAIETSTQVYCYATATAWIVQAPKTNSKYWCVDSTGNSKEESAVVGTANTTACA